MKAWHKVLHGQLFLHFANEARPQCTMQDLGRLMQAKLRYSPGWYATNHSRHDPAGVPPGARIVVIDVGCSGSMLGHNVPVHLARGPVPRSEHMLLDQNVTPLEAKIGFFDARMSGG
ncbi:MAG: hypothetical protein H7Y20_12615 [Bryobacteraceae bacterium]|nr:hypothetical protein [Bryobacteraceae bacterium]